MYRTFDISDPIQLHLLNSEKVNPARPDPPRLVGEPNPSPPSKRSNYIRETAVNLSAHTGNTSHPNQQRHFRALIRVVLQPLCPDCVTFQANKWLIDWFFSDARTISPILFDRQNRIFHCPDVHRFGQTRQQGVDCPAKFRPCN